MIFLKKITLGALKIHCPRGHHCATGLQFLQAEAAEGTKKEEAEDGAEEDKGRLAGSRDGKGRCYGGF